MFSIKSKWIKAFQDLNIKEMERLLSIDSSLINLKNDYHWDALIHASSHGHIQIVKMLIEANTDLDSQDKDGWTALMHCSCNSHDRMIKILLASMSESNNSEGETRYTCQSHTEIFKVLNEAGANIFIEDNEKRTCLHHCLHDNNIKNVDYLLNQGLTFNTDKHKDYKKINQETHEYFNDYEGYKEYRMINEE